MPPFPPFRLALVLFFALASVQAHALNPRLNLLPAARNFPPHQARAEAATTTQSSSAAAATTTAAAQTTTQQQVVTTPASSASSAQQVATTAAAAPTSAQQQVTSAAVQQTSAPQSNAAATSQQPQTSTSAFVTTKGGQVVTSILIVSDSPSSASSSNPSQTPAAANSTSGGSSSSVSSSTIIGLSVAGGVAILGLIGFFVWKLTRKRMHDFSNNEEIKWPELNSHDATVPLPTNRTGGSGFDTTADVGRSSIGYAASTAATSTAELFPDPYAVPPLPHMDPNQPYRDDPNTAFYDPYRGPVPPSFDQATAGEAIPMTQLAGRRSPGPGAAYGVMGSAGGRASPVPQVAYGVGGDFGGRASPGPRSTGFAGSGRASPGPQAAYGNYGPR